MKLFKRKRKEAEATTPEEYKDELKELEENVTANPVRQVINDLLYDTSEATLIFKKMMYSDNLPNFSGLGYFFSEYPVLIFKGKTKYFIVLRNQTIHDVSEDWVKSVICREDIVTYIKLFGKPELA